MSGRELLLGWTGAAHTHIGDLPVTDGAIQHVLNATGAVFRVVGPAQDVGKQLKLTGSYQATGWVPIDEYPHEYGKLKVAIIPLLKGPFNNAKSNLKGIEAAALRVPFVASPTPEYELLARQGAGVIARKRAHWVQRTTRLLRDDSAWEEAASSGQQAIRDHYLLEDHAHHWWDAWEQALANRRAAQRTG